MYLNNRQLHKRDLKLNEKKPLKLNGNLTLLNVLLLNKILSQSLNQFQLCRILSKEFTSVFPVLRFKSVDFGPAIKVHQDDFEHIQDLLDAQSLNTISLPGYGFAVIRPSQHLKDTTNYDLSNLSHLQFTNEPVIPYNSDMEDSDYDPYDQDTDCDCDSDVSIIDQFVAEEWTYNATKFLLDTKTNYLYCPNTLQYLGKKTGEFSIDFNHKEK